MPRFSLTRIKDRIPVGLLVIIILAIVSSFYIGLRPVKESEGSRLWTFVQQRAPVYREIVDSWGLSGEDHIQIELVEYNALKRRMLSGFFSGTPLADFIEVERAIAPGAWRGPLEAVGFVDLTDYIERDGLLDKLNRPSFSPWTNRGRIFGLPADVHPVMLAYRADIFEAAGINVEELTTWDKFYAATQQLVQDKDGDGRPDQYVFELQESEGSVLVSLTLQAGGRLFDELGRPDLTNPRNVHVIAHLADWATGRDKVTIDMDLFTGAGHQLRSNGYVLSWIVPDWRSIQGPLYMGDLAGKMKLMPLPAWEEGGRRTSGWGGTMMGFPKSGGDFERNWEIAKRLYLSPELAVVSWKKFGVLTPVKALWEDPVYDEPDEYYSDQPTGRMYLDLAEDVPMRTSSPFMLLARQEMGNAFGRLIRYANSFPEDPSAEDLMDEARSVLEEANENVLRQVNRNVFLADTPEE